MHFFHTPIDISISINECSSSFPSRHKNVQTGSDVILELGKIQQISGKLKLTIPKNDTLTCKSIKLELVGQVDELQSKSSKCFHYNTVQLEEESTLQGINYYTFSFEEFPKMLESYKGLTLEVRHYIRVIIERKWFSDMIFEKELVFQFSMNKDPLTRTFYKEVANENNEAIIILETNKKEYGLEDRVIGKLELMQNNQKINPICISLNRVECSRLDGPDYYPVKNCQEISSIDLIKYFEESCGEAGTIIPFQFLLSDFALQPVLKYVDNEIYLNVEYSLNFKFKDEKDNICTQVFNIVIQREY